MSGFNESKSKNSDKAILSVIGLGYVGLVTAAGFGLKGHKVIGIDVDEEKIEGLCNGLSPLYKEGGVEPHDSLRLRLNVKERNQ